MKIFIIFLLIISSLNSFSQDDLYDLSLDSLEKVLSNGEGIKGTKIFADYYKNGNLKSKYLGIKYFSDSLDRYWESGIGKSYFEDGNLKGTAKYDILTYVLMDTSRIYNKNGSIQMLKIWNHETSQLVYIKTNTTCKYFPNSYKEIWFNKDTIPFLEQSFKYDFNSGIYKKDGIFRYYKGGILYLEKKYLMNKLISKEKIK